MEPTIKDVMTTRVISVTRDASFRTMAAALHEYRISAFPVLDDEGKVIGVVSEADMLAKQALESEPKGMPGMIAGLLRRKEHENLLAVFDRSDEDIRREILDQVIRRDLRTDPATFSALVKDGIVTLEGVAETIEFGDDLKQRVRHVQGVVAVRDRLSYPRPAEPSDGGFDVIARFPVD